MSDNVNPLVTSADVAPDESAAENEGFAVSGEPGPEATLVEAPVAVDDPGQLESVQSGTAHPVIPASAVPKPPYPGELYSGAEGPWLGALREALGYTSDDTGFREDDRSQVAQWQQDNRRVTRNGYPDRGDWDAIFEGV